MSGTGEEGTGIDPALAGLAIYGFASGVVTAVVTLDYLANLGVHTSSYLLGAPPFIALNLLATLHFLRAVHRWDVRWYAFVASIAAYVLLSWPFYGLSGVLRTVVMTALVFLGIALVGLSWRTGAAG